MYFVASFYCREETDRTNQNMCRMALQTFRIRKRDIHMEKVCISTSPVSLYVQIGTNGQVHHTQALGKAILLLQENADLFTWLDEVILIGRFDPELLIYNRFVRFVEHVLFGNTVLYTSGAWMSLQTKIVAGTADIEKWTNISDDERLNEMKRRSLLWKMKAL